MERGFYKNVEFVFLIVGHTKNPCDRMFNLLKSTYRKANVYTMAQTIAKLNEHEQTTATLFGDFRNWDAYLDKLYSRFDAGTMKKYHNFSVDFEEGATFMKIDVSRHEEDVQGRRTKDFHTPSADREKLLSQMPEPLPKPGIKRIKQIELGTKWRKHVPPEFQDEICPVPSKAIVDAHKKEKKKTKKNKATAIQNENDSDDEVVDETPAASSSNTHQGEASQTLQWQQQQTWLAYQQILQQQTQNYPFFPQFNY